MDAEYCSKKRIETVVPGHFIERSAGQTADKFMQIDGIIFDLDGTMWDSTPIVSKAWNRIFEQEQVSYRATPQKLKQLFGRPMQVIADRILPEVEETRRYQILDRCCEEEEEQLRRTPGILFPNLEETLGELRKRHPLFIVSNCQSGYIETFLEVTGLGSYFQDFECPGNTGLLKGPNNRLVMERNRLKTPVYVGDTQGDRDSAVYAGIPFCYAAYGFGTVDGFEYKVDHFAELAKLF